MTSSYKTAVYVGRADQPSDDTVTRLLGYLDAEKLEFVGPTTDPRAVIKKLVTIMRGPNGQPVKSATGKPQVTAEGSLLLLDVTSHPDRVVEAFRRLKVASGLEMREFPEAPRLDDLDQEQLESWSRDGVVPPEPPSDDDILDALLEDGIEDDQSEDSFQEPVSEDLISETSEPDIQSFPFDGSPLDSTGNRDDEPDLPPGMVGSTRMSARPGWVQDQVSPSSSNGTAPTRRVDPQERRSYASTTALVDVDDPFEVTAPAIPTPRASVPTSVESPRLEKTTSTVDDTDALLVPPPTLDPVQRPLPSPKADDLDSGIVDHSDRQPGYLSALTPDDQLKQQLTELSAEEYGPMPTVRDGVRTAKVFLCTGSAGGVGKTTLAYMLSTTLSLAIRRLSNNDAYDTNVWLIETDYKNPKMEDRLGDQYERRNIGTIAEYLQNNARDSDSYPLNTRILWEKIEASAITLDTGVKVLACPYHLSSDQKFLLWAISLCITQISGRGKGYIVLDGETLTSERYERLGVRLAKISSQILLVTDTGRLREFYRAATVLTKEAGLERQQVHMFLNKANNDEIRQTMQDMAPWQVSAGMPYIDEIDRGWVGSASREARIAIVRRLGIFLVNIGETQFAPFFSNRVTVQKPGLFTRIVNRFTGR